MINSQPQAYSSTAGVKWSCENLTHKYNPFEGTTAKTEKCAALLANTTIAGTAVGGAVNFVYHTVSAVEKGAKRTPLLTVSIGAAAGFYTGMLGLWQLSGSLKPIAQRNVDKVIADVRRQLDSSHVQIQQSTAIGCAA